MHSWLLTHLVLNYVMNFGLTIKICDHSKTENGEKMNIADTLYNTLFPPSTDSIFKNVAPKQFPNSSCYFNIVGTVCSISSKYTKRVLQSWATEEKIILVENQSKYNSSCIPKNPESCGNPVYTLRIEFTYINSVKRNTLISWSSLEELKINNNQNLMNIEPGAFEGLTNVWKLEITNNRKLSFFNENSFSGLENLEGLFLQRNNITHLCNISKALSPKILKKLLHLDLTGNKILQIEADDFLPMKGGVLYTLILEQNKISSIHPQALDHFGATLYSLGASQLNVNSTDLIKFINRTVYANPNLIYMTLEYNLLCDSLKQLLNVLSNKIVALDIGKNNFGLLKPGSFPLMKTLKYLDLSEVMMNEIPEGVINSTNIPNLRHFYLKNNKFTELTRSMVTPTITRLVLSSSTINPNDFNNDDPLTSKFEIEEGVFESMPNLKLLDLSGNNLMSVSNNTFKDAKNLRVLLLRSTSLNGIDPRSFEKNVKLFYLDLSHNIFAITLWQKERTLKDIFYGLSNLLALDLSFCNIYSLNDTTFTYIQNLQYLSLQGNPIFKLKPKLFRFVPLLRVVDLRYSILTSWESNIFTENHCLDKFLLSYNNIYSLTPAMLADLKRVNYIELYANSISCDCDLVNNIQNTDPEWEKFKFTNRTLCSYHADTSLLKYIINHRVSCITYTKAIIACSIMFCLIISFILVVVYFKYKYDIQYRYLLLKKSLGILNNYKAKKQTVNLGFFKYDAFISYSAHDSSFVEKMRMILEKDGSKFKLCVFERDFNPGDNLVDKILESMEVSKVTILVLTEAFAKSEWCRWEMSIAQNKALSQRFLKDSLLIVVKSLVNESLMTPTLKYLLSTRVYLEWHEHSSVRQNIFWEKLKHALEERTQIKLPVPNMTDREISLRKRVIT